MWLRHGGFKEFQDIFYNNGFEGWHLVNLSFDSFGGIRTLKPERINALLDAITGLKEAGSWTVPRDKPEKPAELPPPELVPELPPVPPPVVDTAPPPPPLGPQRQASIMRGSLPPVPSAATPPPTGPMRQGSIMRESLPPLPTATPPSAATPPPTGPQRQGSIMRESLPPVPSAAVSPSTGWSSMPSAPATLLRGASLSPLPPTSPTGDVKLPDTQDVEDARLAHYVTQELTRDESVVHLGGGTGPNGQYLIRKSTRSPGEFRMQCVSKIACSVLPGLLYRVVL